MSIATAFFIGCVFGAVVATVAHLTWAGPCDCEEEECDCDDADEDYGFRDDEEP